LKAGYVRSPSFAALIARLQASDVFVQIEVVPRLPTSIEGRLVGVWRAHDVRYVRIEVALRESSDESIALLGHELQHAAEVADATTADTGPRLVALYERIGKRGGGEHQYETLAAEEMGRRVRRELFSPSTS
jgi:hypothetical protein